MPRRRLHRYYGNGYAHFITTSCFRRLLLLQESESSNFIAQSSGAGSGSLPLRCSPICNHARAHPSTHRKTRVGKSLERDAGHQARRGAAGAGPSDARGIAVGHRFGRRGLNTCGSPASTISVVWSAAKQEQKLRYLHEYPVKCGLALESERWRWRSGARFRRGGTFYCSHPPPRPL